MTLRRVGKRMLTERNTLNARVKKPPGPNFAGEKGTKSEMELRTARVTGHVNDLLSVRHRLLL